MNTTDLTFKLFCPYQIAWMNDSSGIKLAEKSRRIGWTYADAFIETINRIGPSPTWNYDLWYSATDMTAATEYIDYVSGFAEMVNAVIEITNPVIDATDDDGNIATVQTKRVTFDNGLRITAGSSNPNFFRSKGGTVKLDELAFHKNGRVMLKAALASARFWGYPISIWSSHHGESYFGKLVDMTREGKFPASLHSVNIVQAVEQGIVERVRMRREKLDDVPAVDLKYRQEWLDERRAECPDEDVWNEEFMCIRSSDNSSLLSYDLIQGCEASNLKLADDNAKFGMTGTFYAGYDVARRQDLAVLYVLEKVGDVFWTRQIRVFRKATFSAQEGALNALLSQPAIKRLVIDETGIGMQMAERLQDRWGKYRVEGVTFTAQTKAEMAMPLRRLFEDRLLRIPADDDLREDLHSIKKIVTSSNNIRLDAERSETDGHADRFWALAMAYQAADKAQALPVYPHRRKPIGF